MRNIFIIGTLAKYYDAYIANMVMHMEFNKLYAVEKVAKQELQSKLVLNV